MKFIVFAVVASLFTLAAESLEAETRKSGPGCYHKWCFIRKTGLNQECCPGDICPPEDQGAVVRCETVSLMFSLRQVFSLMAIEILGIQVGDGHLRVGNSEKPSV
jgi:hypothetical protein